jgi:ketosteroid isomerase-like protein
MKYNDLARSNLVPFDNLAVIRKYFAAVKAMDKAATSQKAFDTGRIMALWHADGRLSISGKPIGEEKSYRGSREIAGFYKQRAKGVHGEIAVNASAVDVANAKSADHVVASGVRYVVTHEDEGLQIPFTHNFTMRDGRIAELRIHVGTPAKSEVAPLGNLNVEDMGRLSAMAWMVA